MKKLKYLILFLLVACLSSCHNENIDFNKEKENVIPEAYKYVIGFKEESTSWGLNTRLGEIIPSFDKDGKFERFVFTIYRDDNLDSFLFAERKNDGSYDFTVSHEANFKFDSDFESVDGKKYIIYSGTGAKGDILIGENKELSFRSFKELDESYRDKKIEDKIKDFDENVERPETDFYKDPAILKENEKILKGEEIEKKIIEENSEVKEAKAIPVKNGNDEVCLYIVTEITNEDEKNVRVIYPYLINGQIADAMTVEGVLKERFPELFSMGKDLNIYKFKGYGGFIFTFDDETYNSRREKLEKSEFERLKNN